MSDKVILETSNPNAERGAVARKVVSAKVALRALVDSMSGSRNTVSVKTLDGELIELPELQVLQAVLRQEEKSSEEASSEAKEPEDDKKDELKKD